MGNISITFYLLNEDKQDLKWQDGSMVVKSILPEEKILVPVRGGSLAVFRYGAQGGAPILAIHGVTSTNRAWQWFAGEVVSRGYTLYAVDLRGRGASNALPAPYGMKNHAVDMVAVIQKLDLRSVDVIGHSMGAFVAVALLGVAPELVKRSVLIDGGIPLPLPEGFTIAEVMPHILGAALARLSMTFESNLAYRKFWQEQPAFAKGWSSGLDEYADFDLHGVAPEMMASTKRQAVEEDSADLFGNELIEKVLLNLDREVLLLRAVRGLKNEEQALYPQEVLERALRNYPKIKVITVADTNHYDIVLDQKGAQSCADVIYGKRGE